MHCFCYAKKATYNLALTPEGWMYRIMKIEKNRRQMSCCDESVGLIGMLVPLVRLILRRL